MRRIGILWAVGLACSLALLQSAIASQPVIVAVGAGGEAEFAAAFEAWADAWETAVLKSQADFRGIHGPEGQTTQKQRLQLALEQVEATGDEPVWLVLIGHGTFDGKLAKFNLVGPDVEAQELNDWLKRFERPVVVINCASSSAPFINGLSGPDRVIITATRSGFELNFARFGQYFGHAVADPSADLDKDGQTSLLEAFLRASARVEEFYQLDNRLASEHALLDDNGDGQGSAAAFFRGVRPIQAAREGEVDGQHAHRIHLVRSDQENDLSPEVRRRRDLLEQQLDNLRAEKQSLEEQEYLNRVEPLLLEIARLYEAG